MPDSLSYEFRLAYDFKRRLKEWRITLPLNLLESLPDGLYDIEIDVNIKPGSLKIGHYLPGTRIPIHSDEELLSSKDLNLPILNLAWHISDEIENYLCQVSINESDELAVALAAGRYATMKLAQLTGEKDTKSFVDDCIKTTLNN